MNDFNLDQTGGLSQLFTMLLDTFRWGINLMDHIKFGSFSLLDLCIGFLIMGIIISVTLATVKNYAGNVGDSINDSFHKKAKNNNNNKSNNNNGA